MSEALTYIYQIFSSFVSFVFNNMLITQNVSVGWVAVVVLIFGILIRSILNVPRSISIKDRSRSRGGKTDADK